MTARLLSRPHMLATSPCAQVCAALKPAGVFFSMEPRTAGETIEENYAAAQSNAVVQGAISMQYGMSTLHCK